MEGACLLNQDDITDIKLSDIGVLNTKNARSIASGLSRGGGSDSVNAA